MNQEHLLRHLSWAPLGRLGKLLHLSKVAQRHLSTSALRGLISCSSIAFALLLWHARSAWQLCFLLPRHSLGRVKTRRWALPITATCDTCSPQSWFPRDAKETFPDHALWLCPAFSVVAFSLCPALEETSPVKSHFTPSQDPRWNS